MSVSEDRARVDRGSVALREIRKRAHPPCLHGVRCIDVHRPDGSYAVPLRQMEAVVAVNHVDQAVNGIPPDQHDAGQGRVPRRVRECAGGTVPVDIPLELEPIGIDVDVSYGDRDRLGTGHQHSIPAECLHLD